EYVIIKLLDYEHGRDILLKVTNISKSYGEFLAVDNLSFTVKPGEIFGLLGVNGAGKTTTFRMIMGLLDADQGEVTLNGKKIDYSVTDKIGFLTEERSLLTKLTVKEQCLFYGTLKGMTKDQILSKLDELLDYFQIPEYKERKIKELSKGNQQKIQFITAILNEPELLILDEPFAGLDPINTELFQNKIVNMAKNGSMIIFSTHRMEHVELFCKKIVVLLRGKTVLEGYLKDIKEKYRKKNIFVKGDINLEDIKKISGVLNVTEKSDEFEIKISDSRVVEKVFDKIKDAKEVTKFIVEEATLNEIFVSRVGESYDE
ncbi:MAG: ATP-binding cassette domain-containing protein, partial [Bacilli bacterium]|nr:ATP-binding cassette domain-containing protein [Bacilli bacterium]